MTQTLYEVKMPARSVRLTMLVLASNAFAAQIVVGPNVRVSAARSESQHQEVVIAADPNHLGRLFVGSMLDPGPKRSVHSAGYVSFDNGKTWSAAVFAGEYFADDPTSSYAPDGSLYFVTKTNTGPGSGSYSSDSDYLSIRRSRDGGRTWEPVIHGPQANDRPFMGIDWTTSPNRGRIYIAHEQHVHGESDSHANDDFKHAVRLLSSNDGGLTFSRQAYRAFMDQHGTESANGGACATRVLSDGTVVVLVHHMITSGREQATGKSHEVRAWLESLRSSDGGDSLEPAVKILDYRTGYNKANTKAVSADMAVDPGSPRFKDRLYAVWAQFTAGYGEIKAAWSADAGKTWSAPKTINHDSGSPQNRDDYMAAIAVNGSGVVGVTWYDRRDSPDGRGYFVRFSASLDGGESWMPSVRVSQSPNSPDKGRVSPGDTAGLTADAAGVFHAVWIDNRTGTQQVWTAPIMVR